MKIKQDNLPPTDRQIAFISRITKHPLQVKNRQEAKQLIYDLYKGNRHTNLTKH